jgi:hypothetical protein
LRASQFPTFANRIRNFAGLPKPNTHAATLVSNHDQCAEIKASAAFDDFRRSVNENDFLCQFLFLAFQADFSAFRSRPAATRAKPSSPTALLTLLALWFISPR